MSGLDPKLVDAELSAIEPAFVGPDGPFGELDLPHAARLGPVGGPLRDRPSKPPDVRAAFDPRFVAGTLSLIGS